MSHHLNKPGKCQYQSPLLQTSHIKEHTYQDQPDPYLSIAISGKKTQIILKKEEIAHPHLTHHLGDQEDPQEDPQEVHQAPMEEEAEAHQVHLDPLDNLDNLKDHILMEHLHLEEHHHLHLQDSLL
jgi:hypothetical protein